MSSQEARLQEPTEPRVYKYASSFVVFYCNFAVGIIFSLAGPALQSFSKELNASVEDVSTVLTITLACYLAGGLSAGFIFKVIERQKGSILALSAVTIGVTILPHTTSLLTFYIAGGIYGYGIGIFDPAQIAWIIDIWRNEAGPFILSQHFTYSLGALVAPLILEPFLLDTNLIRDDEDLPDRITSRLAVPFGVAGGLMGVGVLAQIILLLRKHSSKNSEDSTTNEDAPVEVTAGYETQLNRKIIIIAACCIFIGFYMSMEMTTMQFLSPFAQFSPVELTEKEAARILSALTFGFAIARGVGIFVVLRLAPQYILTGNIILMVVGNSILYFLGLSEVQWLWAGSICLGLGFSTSFPAFYAYVEKHIFVSESVASIITVFAGLMSSLYPLIVGSSIERHPAVLNYLGYLSLAVISSAFLFLFIYTNRKPEVGKKSTKPCSTVQKCNENLNAVANNKI